MNDKMKNWMKIIINVLFFMFFEISISVIVQNGLVLGDLEDYIDTLVSKNVFTILLFIHDGLTLIMGTIIGVYIAYKICNIDSRLTYKETKKMLILLVIIFSIYQSYKLYCGIQEVIDRKEEISYMVLEHKNKILNSGGYTELIYSEVKKSASEMNDIYNENIKKLIKSEDQKQVYNILYFLCTEIIYIKCIYIYGIELHSKDKNEIENNTIESI